MRGVVAQDAGYQRATPGCCAPRCAAPCPDRAPGRHWKPSVVRGENHQRVLSIGGAIIRRLRRAENPSIRPAILLGVERRLCFRRVCGRLRNVRLLAARRATISARLMRALRVDFPPERRAARAVRCTGVAKPRRSARKTPSPRHPSSGITRCHGACASPRTDPTGTELPWPRTPVSRRNDPPRGPDRAALAPVALRRADRRFTASVP